MKPLPDSTAGLVAYLRDSRGHHLEIGEKLMRADEARSYGVDLVAQAVLHRSLCLIDGFTMLVEQRNTLSAIPLLRLQVDNIIRFYAVWLVNKPHELILPLLRGEPLAKHKAHDGKAMTDRYLCTRAAEHYPWIPSVYRATSGFVHLSMPALLNPVTKIIEPERVAEFAVGAGREWREEEMNEAVTAFIEATKSLMHLTASWLHTKNMVAEKRPKEA